MLTNLSWLPSIIPPYSVRGIGSHVILAYLDPGQVMGLGPMLGQVDAFALSLGFGENDKRREGSS